MTFPGLLRRSLLLPLAALLLASLASPARADVASCRAAVLRASGAFAKGELRALARCEARIRSGKLAPQPCREIAAVGSCLLSVDTTAGATTYVVIGGEVEFAGPDPGAAVVDLDLRVSGLEAADVALEGDPLCPIASLGTAFFLEIVESAVVGGLQNLQAEGACQL